MSTLSRDQIPAVVAEETSPQRLAHPSIGVLLCASKDEEVVEYALNRTLSPALIAEYQLQLPDKKLLEAKLQEFYLQCESAAAGD